MIGGRQQLKSVVAEAIGTIDERYPGYRGDLARAVIEVMISQETSATEAGRRDRIQTIVESLGTSLATSTDGLNG